MKKVYIAHPLRNDVWGNRIKSSEICKQLSLSGEVIPFSPLHAFGYLDPTGDQTSAMQHCFALLAAVDELWVYGQYQTSEGCMLEIEYAGRMGIPICFKEEEARGENLDTAGHRVS